MQFAVASAISTMIVQSADPADLARRVNAFIASLNAQTTAITGLTLAGAGDGYTFVVLIDTALIANVQSGTPLLASPASEVRCYAGGDAQELLVARSAVVVPPPVSNIALLLVDDQIAGAAKGTRFMGMGVYSASPQSPAAAFAQAVLTASQAITSGTPLTFASLFAGNLFAIADAGASLQYTGAVTASELFNASLSVTNGATPQTIIVSLVKDPTGTPVPFAAILVDLAASVTENINLNGLRNILPTPAAETKTGIILTTTQAATLQAGELTVSPF